MFNPSHWCEVTVKTELHPNILSVTVPINAHTSQYILYVETKAKGLI